MEKFIVRIGRKHRVEVSSLAEASKVYCELRASVSGGREGYIRKVGSSQTYVVCWDGTVHFNSRKIRGAVYSPFPNSPFAR